MSASEAERIRRTLGGNVAREREKAGIAQETLGQKSGVARETISRIERCTVIPDVLTLCAFSIALDVPLLAFFTDVLPDG